MERLAIEKAAPALSPPSLASARQPPAKLEERKPHRALESMGRNMVNPVILGAAARALARPDSSCAAHEQEDDWKEMRAAARGRGRDGPPSARLAGAAILQIDTAAGEAVAEGSHGRQAGPRPAASAATPRTPMLSRRHSEDATAGSGQCKASPITPISAARLEQANREFALRESAYFEKAKNAAKAHTEACFEDLICFFEMHNISGAYALAFTANGVRNLSELLLMEEAELNRTIERCELDAVDEILLLEALRATRGR